MSEAKQIKTHEVVLVIIQYIGTLSAGILIMFPVCGYFPAIIFIFQTLFKLFPLFCLVGIASSIICLFREKQIEFSGASLFLNALYLLAFLFVYFVVFIFLPLVQT